MRESARMDGCSDSKVGRELSLEILLNMALEILKIGIIPVASCSLSFLLSFRKLRLPVYALARNNASVSSPYRNSKTFQVKSSSLFPILGCTRFFEPLASLSFGIIMRCNCGRLR